MARPETLDKLSTWRNRISRHQSSGLSTAEFCRRENVSEASFYYWSRRVRQHADRAAPTGGDSRQTFAKAADVPTAETSDPSGAGKPHVEVWLNESVRVAIPAHCTEALRCVLDWSQETDGQAPGASPFQRIVASSR